MTVTAHTPAAAGSASFAQTQSLATMNAGLQTEDWERVSTCPACLSAGIGRFARLRNVAYERCRDCGFTFANPVPSDAALRAFYNSPFYDNYRAYEARRMETQPYFSVSYSDLPRLADWIDLNRDARILDFGCGPGSFLAMLRDRGFANVEGLELNLQSADVARRRHGIELATDLGALKRQTYDVVSMIEVIEHLPEPEAMLRTISALLEPGGRLFITTDSVRNLTSRRIPRYSQHYTGPSHVSLFTERAIRRLIERTGFAIERMETDASSDLLGHAVASPFYRLDFLSPQFEEDQADLLLAPHGLGRLLKLAPRRTLPRPLRAAARVDRIVARMLRRLSVDLGSEHLYVMARKVGAAG